MAMKTVKECDYCQGQVDWSGKPENEVPDDWRTIAIEVYGNKSTTVGYTLEICGAHVNESLSTIISGALS